MKKIYSTLLSCAVLVAFAPGAYARNDVGMGVVGTVTPQADKFLYEYTVSIGTYLTAVGDDGPSSSLVVVYGTVISQFMLPFFDMGPDTIDPASITAPGNWVGTIQSPAPADWVYSPADDPEAGTYGIDPGLFVDPPAVLVFSTPTPLDDGVGVEDPSLSGFSFLSDYDSGNGPTVLVAQNNTVEAATTQSLTVDPPIVISPSHPLFIPEPITLALLLTGGLGLLNRAPRRKKNDYETL